MKFKIGDHVKLTGRRITFHSLVQGSQDICTYDVVPYIPDHFIVNGICENASMVINKEEEFKANFVLMNIRLPTHLVAWIPEDLCEFANNIPCSCSITQLMKTGCICGHLGKKE